MARLTSEQWEQARAEYEVRGVSLGEVARRFGVSQQAASKRARKEGWKQGKSCGVVEKKVSAIKALYEVEQESCDLPTTFRATIDDVVRERLEADHLFAQFDKALILKAHAVLSKVELPEEWETMTRGRRNLAPPAGVGDHGERQPAGQRAGGSPCRGFGAQSTRRAQRDSGAGTEEG